MSKTTITDTSLAKWQHVLSGTIHIISACTIIGIALHRGKDDGGLSFFHRPLKVKPSQNMWLFHCANTTITDFSCDDDDKMFYTSSEGTVAHVPVIEFAFLFAFWSGLWHMLSWWFIEDGRNATDRWRGAVAVRTWDYLLSASLMIVVINTLFGASTYMGVIVAPLLQACVILLGGYLEYRGDTVNNYVNTHKGMFWGLFSVALGLYAVLWVPAFHSFSSAASTEDKPVNAGTAPQLVWIFVIAIFIVFSVFPIIWIVFMLKGRSGVDAAHVQNREFWYNIVSCISKVTLHAFIAISLFAQRKYLSYSFEELPLEPVDPAGQEQEAFAAIGGVIVGVGVLNGLLYLAVKKWGTKSAFGGSFMQLTERVLW